MVLRNVANYESQWPSIAAGELTKGKPKSTGARAGT